MFLGSKARLVRGAENFAGICEPIVYTTWNFNISQFYRPQRPVTWKETILIYVLIYVIYVLSIGLLCTRFVK
jgi:hypothetical protein